MNSLHWFYIDLILTVSHLEVQLIFLPLHPIGSRLDPPHRARIVHRLMEDRPAAALSALQFGRVAIALFSA